MARLLPGTRALRTLEAAARHLNFTRAADEIGLTPAAVSHQIKEIEDQLGIALFTRTSRTMRLTEAGAVLFEACLARLDDGSYREAIRRCYADKQGLQSPFVFWSVLTEPLLELALDCIPAAHLKQFFARLLRNVQANRTGFPDLVRFWPAERRYELVEVKAPGDRLQDNQIRWLQYCAAHGIPARVCHVQWRERAMEQV